MNSIREHLKPVIGILAIAYIIVLYAVSGARDCSGGPHRNVFFSTAHCGAGQLELTIAAALALTTGIIVLMGWRRVHEPIEQ